MKPLGFFRASARIAGKDLRLEWRTLETLSSSLVFSLTVLVIFSFAFDPAVLRRVGSDRLVPGIVWTVLAFAAVVGMTRSFQLERYRDTLLGLWLAPVDRSAVFAGKCLANLIKLVVLEVVVLPLSAVLFDYDLLAVAGPLAGVVLLHSLGLTTLGTLFAAVVMRVGRGEALLATLLFPAATPLFISAVKCTGGLLGQGDLTDQSRWMLLTAGFDVLYFVLALLMFEFVLEE